MQTGNTIKDNITGYKLNLIQTRLKFSDLTISEIAHEMNFTDESHLNKTFKNVFGKTVTQFKKEEIVKSANHQIVKTCFLGKCQQPILQPEKPS